MTNSQIEYIPIDQLVFDPNNPRLPSTVTSKQNEDDYENEVINWMLQFENVTELMSSIGEKGFFPAEPILVVKNSHGLYEVIEGNRRLTAVKLLNEPSVAKKKKNTIQDIISEAKSELIPTEIPSIKFDTRDEVLGYLGYKHITGVQPWDSLAKAKYLKQLQLTLPEDSFYNQCKTLAKIIGSKGNYVRLLLVGVNIYEVIEENSFYEIPNLNEETFSFGTFYTALGRENISKYVGVDFSEDNPIEGLNKECLGDLTSWMFKKNSENFTRLGESRNLTELNKILDPNFPKALDAFKNGRTLVESVRLTDLPIEVFLKSLNDSLDNLKTSRDYLHEISEPISSAEDTLLEIQKIARMMRITVQDINLGNSDLNDGE
ncbi:ParB/RepB/Spo0J family partition protein [uncultured Algibacter sp.]|uniref:ParB/RepB/Spo0J family partition protein n=1 Tax=uncultured Algibacter sp. TaxID=298659 RepID=UPI003217907A